MDLLEGSSGAVPSTPATRTESVILSRDGHSEVELSLELLQSLLEFFQQDPPPHSSYLIIIILYSLLLIVYG